MSRPPGLPAPHGFVAASPSADVCAPTLLPPELRRSAPFIVAALHKFGGAKKWLLEVRKQRRRIGVRALSDVWYTAIQIDDLVAGHFERWLDKSLRSQRLSDVTKPANTFKKLLAQDDIL